MVLTLEQQKAKDAADQAKIVSDHDLRGLPYYDDVEVLLEWTDQNVDPLHKANTPLLPRPNIPDSLKMNKSSNVLLLPDYENGYGPTGYEACGGADVDTIDYICEYWQLVEVLTYFGHKRAQIPPPVWTNTAHRNGVMVLATFIIESKDISSMLRKDGDRYKLADVLVKMAECYGFDGWFMNIESNFIGKGIWNIKKPPQEFGYLLDFLKQLKDGLGPKRKLIWYDAFTKDNQIKNWQNTLNEQNEELAEASGSFMTNYRWTKNFLAGALDHAASIKMDHHNLYFGTECWGCTGIWSFGFDKEVEFEDDGSIKDSSGIGSISRGKGHGGAATGLVVNVLAHTGSGSGLGTAIFSSHWAYQHYASPVNMDRFMWEGKPDMTEYLNMDVKNLPSKETRPDIYCKDCSKGFKSHLRNDFQKSPIAKFARKYPAGSNSFFHTDYRAAYSKGNRSKFRVHVGQYSVLPLPGERSESINFTPALGNFRGGNASGTIKAQISDAKCRIHIASKDALITSEGTQFNAKLRLHNLNIECQRNLEISTTYIRLGEFPEIKLQLVAKVGQDFKPIDLPGQYSKGDVQKCQLPNSQDCITALEIWAQGPAKAILNGAADLIDIFGLTFKPSGLIYPKVSIQKVELEKRGSTTATAHTRLVWTIPDSPQVSDLPYSKITKNFSHFVILAENEELGRAYALEFVLRQDLFKGWIDNRTKSIKFDIIGYAFDGNEIGSFSGYKDIK